MREEWQVLDITNGRDNVILRGTEEEALEKLKKGPPADLMGSVVWTLRKVWTNSNG